MIVIPDRDRRRWSPPEHCPEGLSPNPNKREGWWWVGANEEADETKRGRWQLHCLREGEREGEDVGVSLPLLWHAIACQCLWIIEWFLLFCVTNDVSPEWVCTSLMNYLASFHRYSMLAWIPYLTGVPPVATHVGVGMWEGCSATSRCVIAPLVLERLFHIPTKHKQLLSSEELYPNPQKNFNIYIFQFATVMW